MLVKRKLYSSLHSFTGSFPPLPSDSTYSCFRDSEIKVKVDEPVSDKRWQYFRVNHLEIEKLIIWYPKHDCSVVSTPKVFEETRISVHLLSMASSSKAMRSIFHDL